MAIKCTVSHNGKPKMFSSKAAVARANQGCNVIQEHGGAVMGKCKPKPRPKDDHTD